MATAKKLPSESWRCLIYTGHDANGKRQYKSFTAPTKKQAEYLASQYLMGYEKQTDSNRTVNDIVTSYIDAKKDSFRKKKRKIHTYLQTMTLRSSWII